MTRRLKGFLLVLLLLTGALIVMQFDRFGWAQQAKPMRVFPRAPAATGSSDYAPAGMGMSSGYGNEYESGYAETSSDGYGVGSYSDYGTEDMMGGYGTGPAGRPSFQHRLALETTRLKNARSEEIKARATEALKEILSSYFDSDMKRRQAELAKVKERVAKLEALLEKRQSAKQEIVDLQLRTMVNETEGLGFFSAPLSGPGIPGSSGSYGYGSGGDMYGGAMMGGSSGYEMMEEDASGYGENGASDAGEPGGSGGGSDGSAFDERGTDEAEKLGITP